jgi:hypothetical protein
LGARRAHPQARRGQDSAPVPELAKMLRSFKILAAVVAVLMAAPAAMATWMHYGQAEPDVAEDVTAGWMYADPPTGTLNQVYFNAFSTVGSGLTTNPSPNHNVGALETRFGSTMESWKAVLGVWRDCNGDGYIGLAESAAHAYRVEAALHDSTVCPQDTTSMQAHNDGVWIRELIPILHDQPSNGVAENPRNYTDATAHIWGDIGFPGQDYTDSAAAERCWVRPQSRGTFATTGSFLDAVVECRADIGTPYNTVITTVDGDDATGLALANDEDWNEAGHPLNQPFLGRETSEDRIVTVWDCESEPVFEQEVVDPTGLLFEEPATFSVTPVAPAPGGGSSLLGTEEHLEQECTEDDGALFGLYGLVEGDVANQEGSKTAASYNFKAWVRPFSFLLEGDIDLNEDTPDGSPELPVFTLPDWGEQDLGLQPFQPVHGTYWTTQATALGTATAAPFRHGLDPVNGDTTANPEAGAARRYVTFYARVTEAMGMGLSLPGGGQAGVYGDAWCGSATEGVSYGFTCDADRWNRNVDGSKQQPDTIGLKFWAEPGFEYHLRDIDCFDSGTALTPGECATLPLPAPAKDAAS